MALRQAQGERELAGKGPKDWLKPVRPELALPTNSAAGVHFVIPAKAGIQKIREEQTAWMPAFAGMTVVGW